MSRLHKTEYGCIISVAPRPDPRIPGTVELWMRADGLVAGKPGPTLGILPLSPEDRAALLVMLLDED